MTEGNTQIQLHNDSINTLLSVLTQFAQVCRAMRQHERAEELETIRGTIHAQYHPDR